MRRALLALIGLLALGASPASAHAPFGEQRLLVVFVEHDHPGPPTTACPSGTREPTCPRRNAADFEAMIQNALTTFYERDSYRNVRWTVKVLTNPRTENGWFRPPYAYSRYATPSFVGPRFFRDVAERTIPSAIAAGAITREEVMTYDRFIAMDNHQASAGAAEFVTIDADLTAGASPELLHWQPTASWAAQTESDSNMLSVIEHELGHQLGMPDLYSTERPCQFVPPGGIAPGPTLDAVTGDCMGRWDLMALDGFAGTGANMKMLLGWLDSRDPATVFRIPASYIGPVEIDKLTQPLGRPIVVRIPIDPNMTDVVDPPAFRGFQVECRRWEGNDRNLPGQGAFVTYVDTRTRPQQVVARTSATQRTNDAILDVVDETYRTTTGLAITYRGRGQDGSCLLSINRPAGTPNTAILPTTTNAEVVQGAIRAAGVNKSVSAFVNGIGPVVASSSRAVSAQRRSRRVKPLRRGAAIPFTFRYGNAGTRRGGASATVRVTEPYTIANACSGRPVPRGRVVTRLRLPALAPGKIARRTIRFRPRTDAGSAGVTVSFSGTDDVVQGAVAFETFRTRGRRAPRSRTLQIRVRSERSCPARVTYRAAPLINPPGWQIDTRAAARTVGRGRSAILRLRVRPPAGRRVISIPVAVTAGGPAGQERPVDPPPSYGVIGGIDELIRVAVGGSTPPAFVIPPPPPPLPDLAYPVAPIEPVPTPTPAPSPTPTPAPSPTPTPSPTPAPSSIQLDCTTVSANQGEPTQWTGTLSPAHPDFEIQISYATPNSEPIVHKVFTDAKSSFSDDFTPPKSGDWTVTAAWLGDADHSATTSNTCPFTVGPPPP